MEADRIAALLKPFLGDEPLPEGLIGQLQKYLDLLLRWNARTNLTAIRDPQQIVTRHFGESLFAARVLRDAGAFESKSGTAPSLADLGSGAGFPGVPMKLAAPEIHVTLIESQNKKATFLREVIRTLGLTGIDVFGGRAEAWKQTADIVTLRAVEKFETTLTTAASLVAPRGYLGLLIGEGQMQPIWLELGREWTFSPPAPIPNSSGRIVVVGNGLRGGLLNGLKW
jgi:16S rRNA (guanine527-N7)-methyltransferase